MPAYLQPCPSTLSSALPQVVIVPPPPYPRPPPHLQHTHADTDTPHRRHWAPRQSLQKRVLQPALDLIAAGSKYGEVSSRRSGVRGRKRAVKDRRVVYTPTRGVYCARGKNRGAMVDENMVIWFTWQRRVSHAMDWISNRNALSFIALPPSRSFRAHHGLRCAH